MFKKFFGKKTETPHTNSSSNSKLEQFLLEHKKSGGSDFYPILKPGNWIAKPHAVFIPWIGGKDNPQVLIAFGYDSGENLSFLTNQKAVGLKKSEIYDVVLQNLKTLKSPISFSNVDGFNIATASGNDFASEKILDPDFLKELSQKLKSNELLVSVPRRRCLMACDKNAPESFLQKFQALHLDAWNDDSYGNAPIANGLFEITNGAISGYIAY